MKKIILLALTAMIMTGCDQQQQKIAENITKKNFGVCIYDSCEYLIRANGYKGYFAHKGNCRLCEERDSIKWEKRKRELEELVKQLSK